MGAWGWVRCMSLPEEHPAALSHPWATFPALSVLRLRYALVRTPGTPTPENTGQEGQGSRDGGSHVDTPRRNPSMPSCRCTMEVIRFLVQPQRPDFLGRAFPSGT